MNDYEIVNKINNEVWVTLAPSKIHGIGVIAIRDIPKGTEIGRGQHYSVYYWLSERSFEKLLEPIRNMILDRTQQDEGQLIRFCHPNATARPQNFMNHSDNPNSDGVKTLVDVKTGEEITENYIKIAPRKLHRFVLERYKHEGII